MKTRKKYATGTFIKNYMENPYTKLQQDKINTAKAKFEAETNPLVIGLETLGNLVGLSQNNFGGNKNNQIFNSLLPVFANMKFAQGGTVPNVPVEIEGEEVGETPNGQLFEAEGPSHEKGGIDIALPEGTEMYSKRIKIDGVSMADRKKKRKKKEITLESLLKMNNTDMLLKNSLKRTKKNNIKQENFDNGIQNIVANLLDKKNNKKQLGGIVSEPKKDKGLSTIKLPPMPDIPYEEEPEESKLYPLMSKSLIDSIINNKKPVFPEISYPLQESDIPVETTNNSNTFNKSGVTFGDSVGMLGDLISTFGPYANTLKNRSQTTPNINAFEHYGERGLETFDNTKQYVNQIKDEQLKELQLARNSAIKRDRNSARGINTMRALDLATDQNVNNAQSKIYNQYAQALMNILANEANMENRQDQIKMKGEDIRDTRDRQDNDSYFNALARNISNMGKGVQTIGGRFNQMKTRKENLAMIEELKILGYDDNQIKLFLKTMQGIQSVSNGRNRAKQEKNIGIIEELKKLGYTGSQINSFLKTMSKTKG